MTSRFIDDKTGEIIGDGRSFQIGVHYGDDQPNEPLDFRNLEDVLDVIREALKDSGKPPLQIIVRSWTHMPTMKRSRQ